MQLKQALEKFNVLKKVEIYRKSYRKCIYQYSAKCEGKSWRTSGAP